MEIISEKEVVAQKEHRCGFCGCKINKGQSYIEQRNRNGEYRWTFNFHKECIDILWDIVNNDYKITGVDEIVFIDSVDDYVYENHYDDSINDIAVDWQNLSVYETVLKIKEELGSKNKKNL